VPVIQAEVSVLAGAINPNIYSGSAFEYSRGRSAVSLGVTASATGILVTINSGSDIILEESAAYIATQFPIIPDQMFYNDIMEPMDRLKVSARNSSGGALTVRSIALISQLG